MKVIDLLNKIANNEEIPTRIRYKNEIYKAEYNSIFKQNYYEIEDKYSNRLLLCEIHSVTQLNDEVEIIEEEKKIPDKLSTWFSLEMSQSKELNREYANTNFENMYDKINEIIDYIQENK